VDDFGDDGFDVESWPLGERIDVLTDLVLHQGFTAQRTVSQECGCHHPLIVSDPRWLSEYPALGDSVGTGDKVARRRALTQVVCGRAAPLQTECGAQPPSAHAPGCVFVATAPSLGSHPQPTALRYVLTLSVPHPVRLEQ
jgi:hypothetical protein